MTYKVRVRVQLEISRKDLRIKKPEGLKVRDIHSLFEEDLMKDSGLDQSGQVWWAGRSHGTNRTGKALLRRLELILAVALILNSSPRAHVLKAWLPAWGATWRWWNLQEMGPSWGGQVTGDLPWRVFPVSLHSLFVTSFCKEVNWPPLPHALTVMYCAATGLKQQCQTNMDYNLWNCEPK